MLNQVITDILLDVLLNQPVYLVLQSDSAVLQPLDGVHCQRSKMKQKVHLYIALILPPTKAHRYGMHF